MTKATQTKGLASVPRVKDKPDASPSVPTSLLRPLSDEELVRRGLGGDRWAKEAMYRKHVAQAYRVARRLVGQAADTEDVVQEAFAQAFVDLPQLRQPEALRGWLLRIVVNLAHRRFRRNKVLSLLGLRGDHIDPTWDVDPSCSPEIFAELSLVQAKLAQQSPRARAAWILRRSEGCSIEEVATACSCSNATVKRHIALIDAVMRVHLSESGECLP